MLSKQTIPNALTLVRVVAIPFMLIIASVFPAMIGPMFLLFVLCAITDFLDGYLARKWSVVSAFGTMMDQISDKLVVCVSLLYLLRFHAPMIAVGIILLREIYVSGLREYMALRAMPMPVSKGGKLKTATQMLAIALMLAAYVFHAAMAWKIGVVLLWASAALALLSAAQYTRAALKS